MPDKMKSVCFKCRINKWIVDYRGGCAENVSSKSICLSCEQSEKIEKLEKSVRERDCKIKALAKLVDDLAKKVDGLGGGIIADKCENGNSGRIDENVFTVSKGTTVWSPITRVPLTRFLNYAINKKIKNK